MPITVQTVAKAPIARVWEAYTSPDDIVHWNFASDDWFCPSARGDLRVGGSFSSRMEARDGSAGFDFEGTWTAVETHQRLAYSFGDRSAEVRFEQTPEGVTVAVSFEPETTFPEEMQRAGWQAILENFRKHVEAGER